MRSLSLRLATVLIFLFLPLVAAHADVTVSGTVSFTSLDGSANDADHVANGVFTVTGDLIVNGKIACSDDAPRSASCAMAFVASRDVVINAGGSMLAENNHGSGNGSNITVTAGRDVILRSATVTLPAALISTAGNQSGNSNAGNITITATANATVESGAIVSAGSEKKLSGAIQITGGAHVDISGVVASGPSHTIDPIGKYIGEPLVGGSPQQQGGAITIRSTSYFEPALTVGTDALIVSQSNRNDPGLVKLEGCGIVIKGAVESIGDDAASKVAIRSGKSITVDGRDLGVLFAPGGRTGLVRTGNSLGVSGDKVAEAMSAPIGAVSADGVVTDSYVHLYAADSVSVLGPPSNTSFLYSVASVPGGTVSVIALGGTVSASGRAFITGIGTTGGAIRISSKGNANLDSANLLAIGDFSRPGHYTGGGVINVRSYSGAISWLSGVGDVRPVGSQAPASAQGSIVLTACGSINTSGSQFPTTGPPTGPFPTTQTGLCSPAAPSLPAGEPVLQTCNTPPVANAQTATTLEDTAVTITMTGSDADGDSLTFTIVTPPAHGSLGSVTPINSTSASVVYTPSANYNGSDSFTFQVADGKGGFSTATVTINITPVNDAPNFTVGPNPTSLEDGGPRTVAGFITGITPGPADESAQTVAFNITGNSNPSLFAAGPAIAPNGTLTYTTTANANGSANITVVAQDNGGTANGGVDTSVAKNFTIFITAVNDAPSFTKGADQTVNEDAGAQSVAGWATAISAGPADESGQAVSFVITGNSNSSLFSAAPAVSASGTLTYTPAPNANGTAIISVAAHDDGGTANGGVDSSASQSFTITVNAVNDAPSFTSGGNVTVLEDSGAYSAAWATGISAGPADESSQTVAFNVTANSNAALFAVQPSMAPNGTLTFTAAANAYGSATITVSAQDNGGTANGGVDTSAPVTFTIDVTAVNDAPSFSAGPSVTVLEDSGAFSAAWATGISAGPNEGSQTVTFTAAADNAALFSVQPAVSSTGVLTFTPAANANGTATVTVTAHDDGGTANGGVDTSASQTFTITITAVNDAPSFTKGADQTVLEDSGPQTVPGWATAISAGPADESGQVVTFTAAAADPSLFSVQPAVASDGTLSYTPAANAFGSTTVTVTAHDNGGTANGGNDTSAPQTFTITITAVNDAPSFTGGGNVTVNEDSGAYSAAWATGISAGPNEGSQTVTFSVTTSDPSLFSVQPAVSSTGVLSFTTALNANGSATITVTAHDDGGTANGGVDSSAPQSATITITAVNDAPSFTSGGDVTVLEDSGSYSAAWATGISAGPADESGQTVSFTITGNSNAALFAAGPAISPSGVLTFTPSANAFGSATITVTAQDNGGTANSGADTSAPVTFTINVTAVNDAPSFTKGPDVTVFDNAGPQTFSPWATGISAGPNEAGQTVAFQVVGNSNTSLFSAQPAVSPAGALTFTPAPGANGTATVTIQLVDNGGTANGGVDTSATQTFTITVNHANVAPTAGNDSYDTTGNTALQVGPSHSAPTSVYVTGSVLANDSDPDAGPSPLTASLVSSNPGAVVTLNADGTFVYVPPAGLIGTDTFTYSVSDGAASATGTVTIHIFNRGWYVNNTTAPGGLGRSTDPFNTLAAAQSASVAGDTIYIFTGNGTSSGQNAGITLAANQRLVGEGVALTFPNALNGNPAPVTLRAAGTRPAIGNGGGTGVTVSNVTGVEVAGLDIAGSTDALSITTTSANGGADVHDNVIHTSAGSGVKINSGFGTLTSSVHDNSVSASGTAIDARSSAIAARLNVNLSNDSAVSAGGAGIVVDGSVGTVTVTGFSGNSVDGNTFGNGIVVTAATFDAVPLGPIQQVAGGATTVGAPGNGVGGSAMVLSNVAGDVAFTNLALYADAGSGLVVSGLPGAHIGAAGGAIAAQGGPALNGTNVGLDLALSTLSSTASLSNGVVLSAVNGTIAAAGGSITGAVGNSFDVTGGSGSLTYGGTIVNATARSVSVTSRAAGSVSFTGSITGTLGSTGISLTGNGGSSVAFSGGVTLATGTNSAFSATGGGTVEVTGSGNTLTTTTGTALTVQNTIIGAAGMTFRSISSAGGANGIVLDTTGSLGGLSVSGNGAPATGGTISNLAGADGAVAGNGIYLRNTKAASFAWMSLHDFPNYAVFGDTVNGFSLSNVVINGANGTNTGTGEGSVAFTHLSGSASVTSSNISGGLTDNFRVVNTGDTLNRVTVSGSTFGANSTASGNDGLVLTGTNGVLNVTVQGSSFTSAAGDLFQLDLHGTVASDLVFTGNTLSNNHPAIVSGGGGVTIGGGGPGDNQTLTYNISGNTFRDALGAALGISKGVGTGTFTGTIDSNIFGASGVVDSGSKQGADIAILQVGGGAHTTHITNNQIFQYNSFGLQLQVGDNLSGGNGQLNATVTGNTIAQPGSGAAAMNGIMANVGTNTNDAHIACLGLGGAGVLANSLTGSGKNGGTDFRLRQRMATTIRLPGYAGANNDNTAAVNFIRGNNGGTPSGLAANTVPTGGGFVGGAACP
jgi:hypothetical protein